MRVYVDSSALLKRVFDESESVALTSVLRQQVDDKAALVSSSLAWLEVSRAVRAWSDGREVPDLDGLVDVALSGVLEKPISAPVLALARRLPPAVLRSLDAIHLASAILADVDTLVGYDQRLLGAAEAHGIRTLRPGI